MTIPNTISTSQIGDERRKRSEGAGEGTQWAESWPRRREAVGSSPAPHEPDEVVNTWNLSCC